MITVVGDQCKQPIRRDAHSHGNIEGGTSSDPIGGTKSAAARQCGDRREGEIDAADAVITFVANQCK
jgi:hypothetical protein